MIRLCYTVATPECQDAALLALRQPLPEAFALLASAGYHAAELMIRDPQHLNAASIRRQADDANLTLPAISTGQLRKERGLQLCSLVPAERASAVDALRRVVDFAADLGASLVNIGTLRGQLPEGESRSSALHAAQESIREILAHASPTSVDIAIEPQCRYVSNWLNTVDEGAQFIHGFASPRLRLLFDCYHALLEERSVLASLIRARPHLAWIQLSDTNRQAPGSAQTHFGDFIRVLGALQFEGFLSVECTQTSDPHVAVHTAARHLLPYIEEQNS